jgi:hypothetical protein
MQIPTANTKKLKRDKTARPCEMVALGIPKDPKGGARASQRKVSRPEQGEKNDL